MGDVAISAQGEDSGLLTVNPWIGDVRTLVHYSLELSRFSPN